MQDGAAGKPVSRFVQRKGHRLRNRKVLARRRHPRGEDVLPMQERRTRASRPSVWSSGPKESLPSAGKTAGDDPHRRAEIALKERINEINANLALTEDERALAITRVTAEAAKEAEVENLVNQAKEAGLAITPQLFAQYNALAQAKVNAIIQDQQIATANKLAADAEKQRTDALKQLNQQAQQMVGGAITGFIQRSPQRRRCRRGVQQHAEPHHRQPDQHGGADGGAVAVQSGWRRWLAGRSVRRGAFRRHRRPDGISEAQWSIRVCSSAPGAWPAAAWSAARCRSSRTAARWSFRRTWSAVAAAASTIRCTSENKISIDMAGTGYVAANSAERQAVRREHAEDHPGRAGARIAAGRTVAKGAGLMPFDGTDQCWMPDVPVARDDEWRLQGGAVRRRLCAAHAGRHQCAEPQMVAHLGHPRGGGYQRHGGLSSRRRKAMPSSSRNSRPAIFYKCLVRCLAHRLGSADGRAASGTARCRPNSSRPMG